MTSMTNDKKASPAAEDQSKASQAIEAIGDKARSADTEQLEKGPLGRLAGRFPSDTFLWATLGSIALSASMKLSGRSAGANFVGEWAPTFLALGVFSKLVKIEKTLMDSAHA